MAKRHRTTLVILGALALMALLLANADRTRPEEVATEETRHTFLVPTLFILSVFGAMVVATLWLDLDGFAQGSLVLVALIEVFVLWGWFDIVGRRVAWDFLSVALLVLVLAATVILFHFFQKERPSKVA